MLFAGNAETVQSLPTSDTDTASSMSPYKACRFKPLGICLKKAFVQLKKTQLSSSVSDFDPEKDKFFK